MSLKFGKFKETRLEERVELTFAAETAHDCTQMSRQSDTSDFASSAVIGNEVNAGAGACESSQADEPVELPQLEQYELCEKLGQGGMGVVYRAIHKATGREFAIKFLHKEHSRDPINIKRFQQEAKSASLLTHCNLISCYASGVSSGAPYLVMDLLSGPTLDEVLSKEGFIDLDRFFNVFVQICEALEHAHQKGVLHRDIKPSNIMLEQSENAPEIVKIVDFGIARVLQPTARTFTKLTQTTDVLGSPVYMSPEQCLGYTIDERSDIYSLGVVMYECLAGRPPYNADNAIQTIVRHLQEKPRPINKVRTDAGVPEALEEIIEKCLEKNPEHRYQSAHDLRRAIEGLRDKPSSHRTVSGSVRRHWRLLRSNRNPSGTVAAFALVTLLLSGLATPLLFTRDIAHQASQPGKTLKQAMHIESPQELPTVLDYSTKMLNRHQDYEYVLAMSQQALKQFPSLSPKDRAFFERKIGYACMGIATRNTGADRSDNESDRQKLLVQAKAHFQTAYHLYNQTTTRDNLMYPLLEEMAQCEAHLGDHAKALELYRKALILAERCNNSDKQVDIMNSIGWELRGLDQRKAAIKQFEMTIRLDKQVFGKYMGDMTQTAYLELIQLLQEEGRYEEALTLVDESQRRDKFMSNSHYLQQKSEVFRSMGNTKRANELEAQAEAESKGEEWRNW